MGIIQTLMDDSDRVAQEELEHMRRVYRAECQLQDDIRQARHEIEQARVAQWIYNDVAQFDYILRQIVAAYECHADIDGLPVFACKIQIDTWQNYKNGFGQGGVHIMLPYGIDHGRLYRSGGETLCTRSRRGYWDHSMTDHAVTCNECQRIADRLRKAKKGD